jgi:SAM-dependent MidA family methyltransferase
MSLLHTIKSRLAQNPQLTFMEFMHLALYAPEVGYYSSGLQKLGSGGDFITAPELTPLFGQTLAYQCQQIFNALDAPCLFEYGAGSGSLCVTLLQQLQELNCLPESYMILEVSAHLRQCQQELISQKIPQLAHKVHWLDKWPQTPFNGVILANEVLDAMPVHRFMMTNEGIMESMISIDSNGHLIESFKPCTNQLLLHYINNTLSIKTKPYQSEVNLMLDDWIMNNYRILNQGVVLLIDYGFPRHEYYHPDRARGTIMCHHKHHTHTDFLHNPGAEDITAHVDFTHVAEAGLHAGFHVAGFTDQASFLLSNGLLDRVSEVHNERERLQANQAIKLLLQPTEMGELFKVIALTKHLDISLNGFQLRDKREKL